MADDFPQRLKLLVHRARPSSIERGKGTQEHRDLFQKLREGVGRTEKIPEIGEDHPLYKDFIRLTETSRMPSQWNSKAEYKKWRRNNTDSGRDSYERQKARQVEKYHDGPIGSGAGLRAHQRRINEAMDFYGIDDRDAASEIAKDHPYGDFPPPLTTKDYEEQGLTRYWPEEEMGMSGWETRPRPIEDVRGIRLSMNLLSLAAAESWEVTAAKQTPGQQSAEKFLRAVEPGDLDRLTDNHEWDEADRNLGVSTGGGGHEPQTHEAYPDTGHYTRRFTPNHITETRPTPEAEEQTWDQSNWDNVLGQAGFTYKPHPHPTVVGYYWRPDEPNNASSLGYRVEHPTPWSQYWQVHFGQNHRDGGSSIWMGRSLRDAVSAVAEHNSRRQWNSMGHTSAAKKPKPKKPRKPEEVWYDVHKHPEGVPGGMGKSPEHHLRNRGWKGHTVNEGSGKRTIQYRHPDKPDFVISYGGGSSTKPDHNFRVMYMGTNANIPKVTNGHSLAEVMNKVDELHNLGKGLIVTPMTYDSAFVPRSGWEGRADPVFELLEEE